MSDQNFYFENPAALADEADLVATEGDDSAAGNLADKNFVAISLHFCPTSACTSRC